MPTTSDELRRRANPGAMVRIGDLEAARNEAQRADETRNRFRAILRSVEPLFGRATYLALSEAVEPFEEYHHGAVHHFERAIAELEELLDQVRADHRRSEDKWLGAMNTAREAVGELLRRQHSRKREVPDWLEDLAQRAQLDPNPNEEAPF